MPTADDVLGCADFADGIGVNRWSLEQHVADAASGVTADPHPAPHSGGR
ncbi:MAG TPA: hypothetical protein VK047_12245 [Zeimonas sp.]|nr:hypothetical protein [Zeimonas sp.]